MKGKRKGGEREAALARSPFGRVSEGLITLLTDFGRQDGYVGALKGVIASIAPGAVVIDISHEVEPQNVRHGGLVWASATPYFPPGAIHVAVVDPGVGTRRRIIAFRSARAIYLAPDNGIIGYVLSRRAILDAFDVRRSELFHEPVSSTFHGRDIFAPVAAHLAQGVPLESVGPRVKSFRHESVPRPRRCRKGELVELRGEIIDVDHFGNITTSIRPPSGSRFLELCCADFRDTRLRRAYGEVKPGRALVIVGSTGYLEIAISHGDAARELQVAVGEPVLARFQPD